MLTHLSIIIATAAVASGQFWKYDPTDTCDGTAAATACGPSGWGTLADSFCGSLVRQSPINIDPETVVVSPDFEVPTPSIVGGGCSSWEQYSDNHVFKVTFDGHGCDDAGVTYNGVYYDLLQLHFHSPSEHTINGELSAAEMHLVHQDKTTGALLVIGVPLEVNDYAASQNNPLLSRFWEAGVTAEKVEVSGVAPLNPYNFDTSGTFFNYPGSLTTPPCTEIVNWFLKGENTPISLYDLTLLRSIVSQYDGTIISAVGNNNRPTMPISGRTILTNSGGGAPPKCLWDECTGDLQCEGGSVCTGSGYYSQCLESADGYDGSGCVKTNNGPWGYPFMTGAFGGCSSSEDCCNDGAMCVAGKCLLSCEASSAMSFAASDTETTSTGDVSSNDFATAASGFAVGVFFTAVVYGAYVFLNLKREAGGSSKLEVAYAGSEDTEMTFDAN